MQDYTRIVAKGVSDKQTNQRQPFGQWLVENLSSREDEGLELPDRNARSSRTIPFSEDGIGMIKPSSD